MAVETYRAFKSGKDFVQQVKALTSVNASRSSELWPKELRGLQASAKALKDKPGKNVPK